MSAAVKVQTMFIETEQHQCSGKIYKVMGLTNEDTHYHEYLQMMEKYNSLGYTEEGEKEKQRILKELFAEVGENAYIQTPYHAMWGGRHVHLGKNVYVNFNATFVDDAQIYIGAASVVTKDIPPNVLAVGSPARILREITPEDEIYYDGGKLISENIV